MAKFAGYLCIVAFAMAATLSQAKLAEVVELCKDNSDNCVLTPKDCLTNETVPCTAAVYIDSESQVISIASQVGIDGLSYAALGFSADQKMGDELITACIVKEDSSTILEKGYNGPKPSSALVEDVKGLIAISTADFHCNFTIDSSTEAGNYTTLAYGGEEYYLLLAIGTYNETANKLGHHSDAAVSAKPFVFNSSAMLVLAPTALLAILFARLL